MRQTNNTCQISPCDQASKHATSVGFFSKVLGLFLKCWGFSQVLFKIEEYSWFIFVLYYVDFLFHYNVDFSFVQVFRGKCSSV